MLTTLTNYVEAKEEIEKKLEEISILKKTKEDALTLLKDDVSEGLRNLSLADALNVIEEALKAHIGSNDYKAMENSPVGKEGKLIRDIMMNPDSYRVTVFSDLMALSPIEFQNKFPPKPNTSSVE